ncbi:MAG: hypothetical protein ACSHX9_03245 [Luteolibacter sp.]
MDPNSFFAAQASNPTSDTIRQAWPSSPGLFFNILASDDLSIPKASWGILIPDVEADGVLSETVQDILIDSPSKFFSVELLPPPNP